MSAFYLRSLYCQLLTSSHKVHVCVQFDQKNNVLFSDSLILIVRRPVEVKLSSISQAKSKEKDLLSCLLMVSTHDPSDLFSMSCVLTPTMGTTAVNHGGGLYYSDCSSPPNTVSVHHHFRRYCETVLSHLFICRCNWFKFPKG